MKKKMGRKKKRFPAIRRFNEDDDIIKICMSERREGGGYLLPLASNREIDSHAPIPRILR